jgi:hypothetical protein
MGRSPLIERTEAMAILIDLADVVVRAKLDKARAAGFITYEQLRALIPAGEIQAIDLEDTERMLSDMGIKLTDGLTEEERDQDVFDAIKSWVAEGNMVPQLTGEAWASISRVIARTEADWRARLGIPDGIDIPEKPMPDNNDQLLDEYIEARLLQEELYAFRMSRDCPDGPEGQSFDHWYSYEMNRRLRLQCEIRDRIRNGQFGRRPRARRR